MMSREEFLSLYEKFIAGQCTPAEIELLNQYQDELEWENEWVEQDTPPSEIKDRIWQRLNESRHQFSSPEVSSGFRWLRVAATLVGALTLTYIWVIHKRKQPNADLLVRSSPVTATSIKPAENKAYLIMANGKKIALTGAGKGRLAMQSGIQISKAKDGMLVYRFSAVGSNNTSIDTSFNTIVTPRGGQYQVVLADGTKVWLNAASSLRFPVAFTGKRRDVILNGEAYFEVAKDKERPFSVLANGTTTRVLGTHFDINAYADNNKVTTTLLEGSVQMSKNGQAVKLVPGQAGTAANQSAEIAVNTADMDETMAWKRGMFVFHDESVANIMKQVSKWYDVDVVYQGDAGQSEFGGTVSRYKNITELLDNMALTHAIHYKIEGRRIIIMR